MRSRTKRLKELSLLFLKLGITSFGGPAVHIAMMEQEVVQKRKWLNSRQFLDLVSATHLIPGPNSTELAIHIGHIYGGWLGLIVAGVCFILPATLIVMGIAWFYVQFGQMPELELILYEIKPIVISIVIHALWSLGRSVLNSKSDAIIVVFCMIFVFVGIHELAVLFLTGVLVAGFKCSQNKKIYELGSAFAGAAMTALASTAMAPVSNGGIFLTFLKIGSVLYGSGYVLLAFLRADFVERLKWMSETQLIDAVVIGQVTPGPVFTTATFIGYLLNGASGALVATVGIFLPAFIFVAASRMIVPYFRRSTIAGYFLDGLNLASFALMATVSLQLIQSSVVDMWTGSVLIGSFLLLAKYRMNSTVLIFLGAMIGLMKSFL